MITKLRIAGIESVFDLAIPILHQLIEIGGGMLTGTDEHVVLEVVTKAKKSLVDSTFLTDADTTSVLSTVLNKATIAACGWGELLKRS